MSRYWPSVICRLAVVLALLVILVGGWTRIMDAGLGCPDWPGCFGQFTVPDTEEQISRAEQRFAGVQVDVQKGSIEMLHRYMAGALGFLILILALLGWRRRHQHDYPWRVSIGLLVLVIAQGMFGMWTVTLKLHPLVVTGHLLGGLLTLTLLTHLAIRLSGSTQKQGANQGLEKIQNRQKKLINLALVVLFVQMILGGWTSANYAGWACNHWLKCADQSVELDFAGGFSPSLNTEQNYLGGVLPHPARAAIQMTHRVGALVVTGVLLFMAVALWPRSELRTALLISLSLLVAQILLGVANAVVGVPVVLAIAHHGIAVALLLSLLWLKYSVGHFHTESGVAYA